MAFQTNVLRGGQWVTETVDLQDALQASAFEKPPSDPRLPEPPALGVLTKTVVESPVTKWILPLSIRSTKQQDLAFIGEHFVQISELGKDGQIHEVIRKNGFGPRIRNAVVLGVGSDSGIINGSLAVRVKSEDGSPQPHQPIAEPLDSPTPHHAIPPQALVLILENGDAVFLFLRKRPDSTIEFVLSNYKLPRSVPYIGYHLAVDPSSRYMAASSPEGVLVVYELHDWTYLNSRYVKDGTFSPIRRIHFRTVQGLIHNMNFLFPRPEDDYHIILFLVVIRKERHNTEPVSRMVTYDWELGDNLKTVFHEEKIGNRLPAEHKMPILLIPLKFKTAFFAVSKNSIGVVKHALSGSPEYERLRTDMPKRTKFYNGKGEPLWTAWTRPARLRTWFQRTDIIFLAREDGAFIFVDIDQKEMVPSVINVGCLETNISTAFATSYDLFSDVLIVGGDSGPGGVWKLAPRTDLDQVNTTPNWSPVVDVATTYEPVTAKDAGARQRTATLMTSRKPDSIFTASGRGCKGSITQWRSGIQAKIGLDIESGEPNKQAWVFPVIEQGTTSLFGILTLPHSTRVLQFAKDFGQVQEIEAEDTWLDLSSRTLFATQQPDNSILQITEAFICISGSVEKSRTSFEELLGTPNIRIDKSHGMENTFLLSAQERDGAEISVVGQQAASFNLIKTWKVAGEITAVSLFRVLGEKLAGIASISEGQPSFSVYTLDGQLFIGKPLSMDRDGADTIGLEAVTSICAVDDESNTSVLILGTRCGHMITMSVSKEEPRQLTWMTETLGISPVDIFPAPRSLRSRQTAFASCDGSLVMLSDYSARKGCFGTKSAVIATDSNDMAMPSPPIHSICSLDENLSEHDGHMSLLMLAGSRILMTDIWPQAGLVPRSMTLNGSPLRVIYSKTWKCLIVALIRNDRPTLEFLDPENGAIISDPSDKEMNSSNFISGLGHEGDRVYGLHEWLYVKDGRTFSFILVTTKDGRLLIVSLKETEVMTEDGPVRRLKYWTRYKKWLSGPVSSITGDADGLIFCVDRTLHWEVLDLVDKKLKPMKEYLLDSPAVQLKIVDGKIHALTFTNSLEVIDHRTGSGSAMSLLHTDQVARRTVHMLDIGSSVDGSEAGPVTLLADYKNGFAGVWVPKSENNLELRVVFEGLLPSSVRRFVKCWSRPLWVAANRGVRYGAVRSSDDGAEMLGVGLDGALYQFTLIEVELWRLLCLIQTLAHRSPLLYPLYNPAISGDPGDDEAELEPQLHPRLMHIDGDILEKCTEGRILEKIVGDGDGLDLFCEYLDGIEGGICTSSFRDSMEEESRYNKYFELAYEILDYLLAPVL
ncbi:thermotolerance protein [Beauveria brongniartii RCEF 3172]|uniref:Thermotolerance protein n=1 Tax=Beauveria brongniartii RCEF 3172 TaxID=1081107 RepID=A0A167BBW1_9HYPO|nr:thermotolerance protein [Beauveria brongniartii RCEF 3172]